VKPTVFPEQNTIFAKDSANYIPLTAHKSDSGMVISCWSLSFMERLTVLFTGKIWLSVLTFNKDLQPQLPQTSNPFKARSKRYGGKTL